MIVNPPREAMGLEAKLSLQNQLLKKQMQWLMAKSAYYKGLLAQYCPEATPETVVEEENWQKIPVTKELPQDIFSLLTGPISTTLRFNLTLENNFYPLTQQDLSINLDMVLRALAAQNINNTSMVVICGDYAQGHILDLHYACEALGATVFPCSKTQDLSQIIDTFHPDTVIGDPVVGEFIVGENINLPKFLLISTYFPEELPDNFQVIYVNPITSQTGLAFTCEDGNLHLQDDYLKWDIVEDKLVFTPLTAQALPLLKVATNIPANILTQNLCSCGRTLATAK